MIDEPVESWRAPWLVARHSRFICLHIGASPCLCSASRGTTRPEKWPLPPGRAPIWGSAQLKGGHCCCTDTVCPALHTLHDLTNSLNPKRNCRFLISVCRGNDGTEDANFKHLHIYLQLFVGLCSNDNHVTVSFYIHNFFHLAPLSGQYFYVSIVYIVYDQITWKLGVLRPLHMISGKTALCWLPHCFSTERIAPPE